MLIEWDDSFAVDGGIIDEQHRQLIEILNATFRCLRAVNSKECDNDAILVRLREYAGEHFVDEEGLMRDAGYPALEQHIKEHGKFLERIDEFAEASRAGRVEVLVSMLTFLDKWLIAHIINSDKRFAHFLREQSDG